MSDESPEVDAMSVPDSAWISWAYSPNGATHGFCDCGHEGLSISWHAANCPGAITAAKVRTRELLGELYEQWKVAHELRCGHPFTACEEGDPACEWPLPPGLQP